MNAAHILVVDDDRDTRDLYRLVFELGGYRVSDAATIADGVRLATLTKPDAVLTDWLLADGNAFSLCESLHRHGRTRLIPIVAATGLSLGPEDIARARTLGCVEVLLKPVHVDELLATVNHARGAATGRRLRAATLRMERFVARARRDDADRGEIASLMMAYEARHARPGVALIVADDRGRYVAANADAASLTGYAPQELTQLSVWDITPLAAAADAHDLWTRFIESGTLEGDYVVLRRDGEPVRMHYVAIANIAPGLHLSALSAAAPSPFSALQ